MKLRKVLAFVCAICMLAGSILPCVVSAEGKAAVKRNIAIVYDNSGSMFQNGNKAWCQAQYAMEVFATMMNDGDQLLIYPMQPVTPDGSKEKYTYQKNPLKITSDEQKGAIHTLCSDLTESDNTPIESVDAAYKGIEKLDGEKWLIVLTDGTYFFKGGKQLSTKETKTELETMFKKYSSNVNIMYLGIGDKIDAPQITPADGSRYEARTTDSENIPKNLSEMCNMIFGRDSLPEKHKGKKAIDFDIPLSKLYVFAQGENVGDIKLTKDSKAVTPVQGFAPTYGNKGCISNEPSEKKFGVDDKLNGAMAVYTDLDSGKYEFYASGKPNFEFYYELDADLQVDLLDSAGKVVASPDDVVPGDYKVKYAITDKDGNEIKSDLLGNVSYLLNYTVNGEPKEETSDKTSGEMGIHFDADDKFSLDLAQVHFLSDYEITKTGADFDGALRGEIITHKGAAKTMEIAVSGGEESIDGDMIADFRPYYANLAYDGQPLSDEMLDEIKFEAVSSCDDIVCEVSRDGREFKINLAPAEGVETVAPGDYQITMTATYSSDLYEDAVATAQKSLTVNEISDKLVIDPGIAKIKYSTVMESGNKEIIAKVTYNGQPLTPGQFEELEFYVEAAGLKLNAEPLPDQSAYSVKLDPDADLELGDYVIKFSAAGVKDRYGKSLTTEKDLNAKVQLLPTWANVLLVLAGLAVLGIIATIICRQRVLPRKISHINSKVLINGKLASTTRVNTKYPKKGKKRNLTISIDDGGLKNVSISATLYPHKDSFLILPNNKRKAMVVFDSVQGSSAVESIEIYGKKYTRDKNKSFTTSTKNDYVYMKGGKIRFSGNKQIMGKQSKFVVEAQINFPKK